jgi:high-affinity Fe2+/Pb2+ permease
MLQPERAIAWGAALLLLACMAAVLFTIGRRDVSIRDAVVFAGVMMVIALGGKLALALGVLHDAAFTRRATNVLAGTLLLFMGNDIPQRLAPAQCSGEKIQGLQRLAGWTWVLAGLGYAVAWLVLPLEVADPVSLGLIVSAMFATVAPILWRGVGRA